MLYDLTRDDWLTILELTEEQVPEILILRGTRNLREQCAAHRAYFDDPRDLVTPGDVVDDVFIGRLKGRRVGFASVYGGAMAAEIVHLFAVLGTSLVLQTGCCGAVSTALAAGDLVLPSQAECGEGAARYYGAADREVVSASVDVAPFAIEVEPLGVHSGSIYTTAALFAESRADIRDWAAAGHLAVDMETATTFAVARHFKIACAAILFVWDNPALEQHLFCSHADERRHLGAQAMWNTVTRFVREYAPE